jgi:hypothetical protein
VRDASIDSLIQKMISVRMRESSESCADANTMAAYLEASLSPQEMAAFEAHVSDCASCQEVLALSMKLQDRDAGGQTEEEQSARKKLLFRFAIPIPVLGGVVAAIVLIAVLFRMVSDSGKNIQPPQSAELHAPARQTEIATRNIPPPPPVADKDSLVVEKPKLDARLSENKAKALSSPISNAETESIPPATRAESIPPSAPAVVEPAPGISAEADMQKMEAKGGAFPRGEESIARPSIYAAQNRIAASNTLNMAPINATSPRDAMIRLGDLLQRRDLKAEAGEQRAQIVEGIGQNHTNPAQGGKKIASQGLGGGVRQASRASIEREESRKIGEKAFYLSSVYWIDGQCIEHQDEPIVEITSAAPEYGQILTQYPELRNLRPALIYWNGKIYLLRL